MRRSITAKLLTALLLFSAPAWAQTPTQIVQGGNTATVDTTVPAGGEAGLTVRTIPRKNGPTTPETTTILTSGSVYTSGWKDTNTDGVVNVFTQVYSDVASAAGGFTIQCSNDTSNANLTFTLTAATTTVSAATLANIYFTIPTRYWRIVYTNGGTNQAAFEIAHTSSQVSPMPVSSAGNSTVSANILTFPAIAGEHVSDNVLGIIPTPIISQTYSTPTIFTDYGAATSGNIKASNGLLTSVVMSSTNTALTYLDFYNTTGATTGAPFMSFAVGAGTATVPIVVKLGSVELSQNGVFFSTGITYCVSTSNNSCVAATAANIQMTGTAW